MGIENIEMSHQSIGITSLGYYLPTGRMTSLEMSQLSNTPENVFIEKIGIFQKCVVTDDEQPSEMGTKAALSAIDNAGIRASDIDLIVYCGVGDYDYRLWSPAAKIQSEIGADQAFAFEVRNFCNSGNLGIDICRNMLIANTEFTYGLVVCSDRLSSLVDYSNQDSLSTFMFADGATAAILKKGETSNQILAYHAVTDSEAVDCFKIPLGGTRLPFHSDNVDQSLNYMQVADREKLEKIISEVYLETYKKVIFKSLQKSSYTINDVDFIFTNQGKKSLLIKIFSWLGLTLEQTFISLPEHGNLGASDTLLGLCKSREEGKIKPGNLVVLASSAAGFSWGALTIKF
ncbi:beta-ketoacyl-ACP reductase [Moorena bouillonii PNG]|uniref:Beta-ketoacyl-ACP reductase n=3 Tax=Moorena TaxID=1155738 RepID=A0A1U7MXH0_9CYAN|nr:beta-ketoacyl-ACP reductase [Moorena bouillonii PNG]